MFGDILSSNTSSNLNQNNINSNNNGLNLDLDDLLGLGTTIPSTI